MNYAMAPANYGVAAPMGYAAAPAQTYALAANDSAALALDAADGVIDGKFYGQQVGIAAANVPRPRALSYAPPTPVVPAVYAAPVAAPQPYATPTTYYGAGGKRTTYVNVTEPPMNPGAKPRVSTYHLAQAAFSRHEREEERKEQLAQEEERKRKAYYDACAKTLPPTMARQERGVPDSYQGVHLPQARPTTRAMSMEDPGVPVGRSEPYHYANYDTNTAPRAPIPLTTAPKTTPPPAPKPSYTPEPAYVPPPAPAPVTIPPPAPSAPWTKTTKTSVKAHGSFAWGTMAADPEPEPAYVPPPAPPAPAPPRIPSMFQAAPPSPPMAPAPVPVTIPINNMSDPDIPRVHSESSIGSEPAPVPMARVASIASLPPRAASIVATVIRAPSMNRVPSLHQELAVQRIESMRRIPSATVAQVPSLAKMAPEPTAPDPAAVSPRTGVALAAFRMYDVDGSGELDVDEFHKAMQEMGMGYTFEDAENLFMMMDEDGNGVMSLPEFMAHCQEYIRNGNGAGPLSEAQAEDQARLAFKRYDTDGNGFLDVQEFLQAVKDLGLGTTIEDAEAIFSMADDDGNGTMECEEFVQHCVVAIQNQGQFTEVPDNVPLRSKKSLRKKPSMHTTGDPKVDAVNTFNKFDIDDSGYLDIYEFMSAMKELGLGFTFEDAKSLFSQIDVDDSGTMDVEEFTEHYIKYCHQA